MSVMLYTKYRPKSLKEVRNQDHVTGVLLNSINLKSVASAYLLSGGRGTGKTSIARAFAKDLGINDADIFELDAASNSGVDDIRSLSEMVQSRPYYSNYKMYILDEVHMLSKAAANAFLKILEEPPRHVIFVLATTDPHKLPETILSRCLHFTLNKPTISEIEEHLSEISIQEGRSLDKSGLRSIAIVGDGSYRDSLASLQKVLSSTDKKSITEDEVVKILNIAPILSVFKFINALDTNTAADVEMALFALREIESSRQSISFFAKNVITFTRTLLFLRFGIIRIDEVESEYGDYVAGQMRDLLQNKSYKINSKVLKDLLETEKATNFPILQYELLLLS